jgi:hypothetical protein
MKCPQCGCEKFYIKDPDDAYETYEFVLHDGKVAYGPDVDASSCPELCHDTETYCDMCSWHGPFDDLSNNPE